LGLVFEDVEKECTSINRSVKCHRLVPIARLSDGVLEGMYYSE